MIVNLYLNDIGSNIIGYEVERRDIKNPRWVKITKEPWRFTEYNDEKVTDGHQYEYRVTAVNAAGPGTDYFYFYN